MRQPPPLAVHINPVKCRATRAKAVALGLGLGVLLLTEGRAVSGGPDLTARARTAVQRGSEWLVSEQEVGGGWSDRKYAPSALGVTALCLRALLESGLIKQHQAPIQKAVDCLLAVRPAQVPDAAMVLDALLMADSVMGVEFLGSARIVRVQERVRECAEWLARMQIADDTGGRLTGGWSYPGGRGDIVNTSLACCALSHAARKGVPVRREMWRACLDGIRQLACQVAVEARPGMSDPGSGRATGGPFRYSGHAGGDDCTHARAAAGALVLEHCIAQLPSDAVALAGSLELRQRTRHWLAGDCKVAMKLSGAYVYYWLWLLRDLQVEFPHQEMEDAEWWPRGAQLLIQAQSKKGGWDGGSRAHTAMAVIFLARQGVSHTDSSEAGDK